MVLDFYATWCEPCRVETPHLVRLQNEFGPKGFQVIGLNVGGDEDREKVPATLRVQYSIPTPYPDDDVVKYLSDNENIPQSFHLRPQWQPAERFVGYGCDLPWNSTVIRTAWNLRRIGTMIAKLIDKGMVT